MSEIETLKAHSYELQNQNHKLHQINQELQRVNAEYQSRIEELIQLNDDLMNYVALELIERKRSEIEQQRVQELQEQIEVAKTANRAKSRFLATMSHELRTPLNAILGYTQVLLRSDQLSSEHTERLNTIYRSGNHLLSLINDILTISKIEAGKSTLQITTFKFLELISTLQEIFYYKGQTKGVQFFLEVDSDVPAYCQTDQGKLRQILINLISNAIKFTPAGQVKLQVSRWDPEETTKDSTIHLMFEVSDTGLGIAPKELNSIFEPFSQAHAGQMIQQGTGLGLAIAKEFVELMQGEITVESQLGQGSLFRVLLPVITATEKDIKVTPLKSKIRGLASKQLNYQILVADDHRESREALVELLESVGFDVRSTDNGAAALELWQSWSPDLIWMDIRMPEMDGLEATRRIKQTTQEQKTVIIALTASAFEEERAEVLAAGCDDFVGKPFREEEIFEKMEQYLGICYASTPENSQLSSSTRIATLSPEDISMMPQEWLNQLYSAAYHANEARMLELIEQIPTTQANLIKQLLHLVQQLQFEVITQLCQGYLECKQG